jgi:hypothetical protein
VSEVVAYGSFSTQWPNEMPTDIDNIAQDTTIIANSLGK